MVKDVSIIPKPQLFEALTTSREYRHAWSRCIRFARDIAAVAISATVILIVPQSTAPPVIAIPTEWCHDANGGS
jgi:hypothetical protein